MDPKDFSNNSPYNQARYEVRYSLNRKRQIINQQLDELHSMQMDMIEDVVAIKQSQGFPEAIEVINYIREK